QSKIPHDVSPFRPEAGGASPAPTARRDLKMALLRGSRDLPVELAGGFEAFGGVFPVPAVPDDFEEVGLPVLVLEVVGVLPGVEDEDGDSGLRDVGLVVVD